MPKIASKPFSTAHVMKTFDLGRNALRLYEEMGLLTGLTRTEAGYREFSGRHIDDLRFIIEAKKVGFTLNEIKGLLEVIRDENKITCGTVSSELTEKIKEIEVELQTLQSKKEFLGEFLGTCSSKEQDSACNVMSAGFTKKACCD